jgi:hypothetical protein
MEVGRHQPVTTGDGHAAVTEGRQQRSDHVASHGACGIEDHDDRAGGATQGSLQGIARSEGLDGPYQFVVPAGHLDRAWGHDHDLGVVGQVRSQ